jgi:hypothetical protein
MNPNRGFFINASRTFAAVCVFAWVSAASTAAAADAVTHWNDVAATNINAAGRFPAGLTDMAKVHLAIHDAVQAYEHTAEHYCADIANAAGSPSAAVAKAARDVLVAQLPAAQDATVEAAYQAYLTANNLVGDAGIGVGQQAAACIIGLRTGDGSFPANPPVFVGGTQPGEWRPTTPGTSMAAPWLGGVTPFALKTSDQLVDVGPPLLTSGRYTQEYNEVKAVGAKNSTTRTAAQTELANFYSDNLVLLMQRTLRTIAETYGNGLAESARLLALANVAAADAAINSWNAKVKFNFWRPVTAIREGQNDGNDATVGDPTWEPFLTTPPYPDFTSGANNLAASMTRTLKLFFRSDSLPFTVESKAAAATQKFRTYEHFSDLASDMIEVRIYQGIHFRSADDVAYRTGVRSADWAVSHILKPLGGKP